MSVFFPSSSFATQRQMKWAYVFGVPFTVKRMKLCKSSRWVGGPSLLSLPLSILSYFPSLFNLSISLTIYFYHIVFIYYLFLILSCLFLYFFIHNSLIRIPLFFMRWGLSLLSLSFMILYDSSYFSLKHTNFIESVSFGVISKRWTYKE